MPYSFFRAEVGEGNVAEVTSTGDTIEGDFKKETAPPKGVDGSPSTHFKTERPAFADDGLIDLLLQKNVVINAHPIDEGQPLWETLLFGFGPTILIVGLFVLLARRAQAAAGGGGLGGFGRSRAKRYDAEQTKESVDFGDVAGIDEAEDELVEVVDFLRNPGRYTKLGASVPRGVLLSGPPGTGKTLLARAVAGEAGVPFFSLSASEFIEAIVGVGASRVRDLFAQAKAAAPAIIFIDELDAIGRSRGGGVSLGGHDEREQTLNQILTEMDGFSGSEGVIVIASTNRPEVLDSALLRPGRFDRRVTVNPPDQTGRRLILEVHTRGVPLAEDVDLQSIAASTPGMVGADLRNLVNEAALTAARREHEKVQLADFTDSLEKIVLGAERKIVLSPDERERTAYHESGHALLGMLQPGADPVRKISIIPRGRALGVTFQSPVDRPVRLLRRLPEGAAGRLAGRARRRAPDLRRPDDRRRVRPRAGHAHRPRDGRAVGDVRRRRPGLRPPGPQRRADALPRGRAAVGAHARAGRQRGPPDPRGVRRRGALAAQGAPRAARGAHAGAARARDARRGRRLPDRRRRPGAAGAASSLTDSAKRASIYDDASTAGRSSSSQRSSPMLAAHGPGSTAAPTHGHGDDRRRPRSRHGRRAVRYSRSCQDNGPATITTWSSCSRSDGHVGRVGDASVGACTVQAGEVGLPDRHDLRGRLATVSVIATTPSWRAGSTSRRVGRPTSARTTPTSTSSRVHHRRGAVARPGGRLCPPTETR